MPAPNGSSNLGIGKSRAVGMMDYSTPNHGKRFHGHDTKLRD
jgi:hypothetical protein